MFRSCLQSAIFAFTFKNFYVFDIIDNTIDIIDDLYFWKFYAEMFVKFTIIKLGELQSIFCYGSCTLRMLELIIDS